MSDSKNFFISYSRADKQWAEWIAWILEEAGYTVVVQAWDFRPGGNFVLDMQRAAAESEKTIAVLSEAFFKSSYTQPEWAAAFADDPDSLKRKLIPIRVEDCRPTGLLRAIVYVDLLGLNETDAKREILNSLAERAKPASQPSFPGAFESQRVITEPKAFPQVESIPAFHQVKLQALRKRYSLLCTKYEAANNQLDATLSEPDKIIIKAQIEMIEKETMQIEEEISALVKRTT